MITKVVGMIFPRNRYPGGTTAKYFYAKNRSELQVAFGGASKVYFHVRVYDRSASGTPSLDFESTAGCLNGENPAEALRAFTVASGSPTPTLPWNAANMTSVPDDGTFTLAPTMGMLDVLAKVSGSAACWVEFEAWYTAEYA